MRRMFLAINIPEEVKQKIKEKRDVLESMLPGARFISEDNWHITLVFLGYQEDGAVIPIIESMESIISKIRSPRIDLTSITYAPPKGVPRMIWLNGSNQTSKDLLPIKIALEDEMIKRRVRFGLEKREYSTHINLAKFTGIHKKDLPDLDKEFDNLDWSFEVESLDLMESRLSKSGAKYEILQKIDFAG